MGLWLTGSEDGVSVGSRQGITGDATVESHISFPICQNRIIFLGSFSLPFFLSLSISLFLLSLPAKETLEGGWRREEGIRVNG